jgi:uncharacterized protein
MFEFFLELSASFSRYTVDVVAHLLRGVEPDAARLWRSVPVLRVEGPRGVGKTTLAKRLVRPDAYVTLADVATKRVAEADLRGWLESLPLGVAIDEAQLVPKLSLMAKQLVDQRNGQPGQFLLTGSSALPIDELGGTDPLAGRVASIRVEPFAQCELEGTPRDVVSALFDDDPQIWSAPPMTHRAVLDRFEPGGMPTLRISDRRDRDLLLPEYVRSLFRADVHPTQRNVEDIARFYAHLSARSSQLENLTQFGGDVGIALLTVQRYLDLLTRVFLVFSIPGFRPDPAKKAITSRRIYTVDPLFAAHSMRLDVAALANDVVYGSYLETIVADELRRLSRWTQTRVSFGHWRKGSSHEVDLLMESKDGRLVGIEMKWARSVGQKEFAGLRALRNEYPTRFHRGFVLHPGDRIVRIEDDLWALPLSVLWNIGEPVFAEPSSLAERLERVRLQLERTRTDESAAQLNHERLITERRINAQRQFEPALNSLQQLISGLEQLGLEPVAIPPAFGASDPTVAWSGSGGLSILLPAGRSKLQIAAWVSSKDPDTIDWSVAVFGPNGMPLAELDGRFATAWNADPVPRIEECLGRFIDELPRLMQP